MALLTCFPQRSLPELNLASRLFRRKPKEHCFLEVHNLLGSRDVQDLTAADVETILSEYKVAHLEAAPRFLDFYGAAARHLATDDELSEGDKADLRHLRQVLGLEEAEAIAAERRVLAQIFRVRFAKVLDDGRAETEERAKLQRIAKSFALPPEVCNTVYKEEVMKAIQRTFDEATEDRRYTEAEERYVTALAESLGVHLTPSPEDQQNITRFRQLASIDAGRLPVVSSSIRLPPRETVHAEFPCRLHELRTVTRRINYGGLAGNIRLMKGLSYRYGSISLQRVTSEDLRHIDTGTLYVTNKRLLFDGAAKNRSIPYQKVIGFTMYTDGVQVHRDTGRDPCFLGDGDLETLGAILDVVIAQAHGTA